MEEELRGAINHIFGKKENKFLSAQMETKETLCLVGNHKKQCTS